MEPTKKAWLRAIWYCVLTVILAAPVGFSAETETELPARPFHVERTDGKRSDATFTVHHGPFRGVVYYAVPPDDPSQSIESVELLAETRKGRVEAVKATDASPFKKRLLKLELDAGARSLWWRTWWCSFIIRSLRRRARRQD